MPLGPMLRSLKRFCGHRLRPIITSLQTKHQTLNTAKESIAGMTRIREATGHRNPRELVVYIERADAF